MVVNLRVADLVVVCHALRHYVNTADVMDTMVGARMVEDAVITLREIHNALVSHMQKGDKS